MNLHHIRQFLAVAESGSIRGAARTLGLSQPAITKALKQLEREVNVPLVQRNARGVSLTSFGRAFLARAKLIESEVVRAQHELAQLAGGNEGNVSFGVAPSAAVLLVPQVVARFHDSQPGIFLRMVGGLPHSTIGRVCDGSLDFVIGPRPLTALPANVGSWSLFLMERAITLRREHPLAGATSLADFARCEWVLPGTALDPSSPLFSAFAELGLPRPRVRIQAESFLAAQALVAKTDLVALMPRRMIEDGLMREVLVSVSVPELNAANSIELFFREDTPLTPSALALAEAFRKAARAIGPAS